MNRLIHCHLFVCSYDSKMNVYNTPDMKKFKPGIAKMQSLDFPSNIQASNNDFDKRTMEAKLYRMNTLMALQEKKGAKGKIDGKTQLKKDTGKKKSEEKASFGQCVFNMANILMVCEMEQGSFLYRTFFSFQRFLRLGSWYVGPPVCLRISRVGRRFLCDLDFFFSR